MSSEQPKSPSPTVNREDVCMWRCCSYPNGLVVILTAQVTLLLACLLSLGAVADCTFVKANLDTNDIFNTDHEDINASPNVQHSLGFFFFEADDGECHWDYKNDEEFENYIDLTSSWHGARRSIVSAISIGWILLIWSFFFGCAGSFAVFDSSFCDEFECEFGRGASGQSVAATLLFAASGVLFFFTKDYSPAIAGGAVAETVVQPSRGEARPDDIENPGATEGYFVQETVQAKSTSSTPNGSITAHHEEENEELDLPVVNSKMATVY